MNNKGFTLIEILVVIAILATLGTIVTISFSKTLRETEDKRCNEFKREIASATCAYIGIKRPNSENTIPDLNVLCSNSNNCSVKLQYVIEEGLVKSEKNPCDNNGNIEENYDDTISVTWDSDGEKTCSYDGVTNKEDTNEE